ncbi:glycoside hydrolase family 15 protein (plasmid) [Streptomyces sp. CA-142005]|uniref:glycoside hydrolase family 15 protein n=1 Tax=Streptomyces sp. CA-142005 TaxID=3240052 RepID=UPI003D8DAF78
MPGTIEDYAIIGGLRSAAMVGRDGSIDWLCCPRFDSQALFAALLGTPDNGRWRLAPAGAGTCSRRSYLGDTLILQTVWDEPGGCVHVLDFMTPSESHGPQVMRIAECVSGSVNMRSELCLRFGYGQFAPWMRKVDGGYVGVAGPDAVWLASDVEQHGDHERTLADFRLRAGQQAGFVFTWNSSHLPRPQQRTPQTVLAATREYWERWLADCTYEGPWRDAVTRSLLTLKALTYEATGGIVAAATTSLPEELGGVRNWDYRYCWLRDATLTLSALLRTGFRREAEAWREWLARAVAGSPEDLQIMYGVAGERWIPEAHLSWLRGYEGSTPVRVGNAAVDQLQLDVYGEVMDALYLARSLGVPRYPHAWSIQQALMHYLETAWRQPDEGLWEIRGPRRHFVHSKVMAWVAADRAVRTVEEFGLPGPVDRWRAMRQEIHQDICSRGFDATRNTFTQSYGSTEVDAALLLLPQVGFLAPDDPRVRGTTDVVAASLGQDGLLRRYPTGGGASSSLDGLAGQEGVFLACSFWLIDALAMTGRASQARQLFERILALRNDVGLLAEEWDPVTQRQVGNMPQAFSHVGLINSALTLSGRPLHRARRNNHHAARGG